MLIADFPSQQQNKMAGTVENNIDGNKAIILSKQEIIVNIPKACKDNSQKSVQTEIEIVNSNGCATENKLINELTELTLDNTVNKNSDQKASTDVSITECSNTALENDGVAISSNSGMSGNPSDSTTQKLTGKAKKSKSKKNKRKKKKSNDDLTTEERADLNDFINNMISKEVQRSTKNKKRMERIEEKTQRTSQGESAESCNSAEDTEHKPNKPKNGEYCDSIQSLTDNGESLPCSAHSDFQSEDSSSDSGKGGSDIQSPCSVIYNFEIPQELCGALIGKHGRLINSIQDDTNTRILVRENISTPGKKLCTIEGISTDIKKALQLIRNRFPKRNYPNLTLESVVISSEPIPISESIQLRIPEGVTCEVVVSSVLNPGHVFLQQPTHPTHSSLVDLDNIMKEWYNNIDAPGIFSPQEGNLCAIPGVNGWYRGKVTCVYESGECDVTFVDYGGYSRLPISYLRQIRSDLLTLPFQSQECFLSNILPVDGSDIWSEESYKIFETLAKRTLLYAHIVGYTVDNVPLIELYKRENQITFSVNREMVNRSVAQWIEYV